MFSEKEERFSVFDWLSNITVLIFLSVLFGYGPDQGSYFIPAEILFVAVFFVQFFKKRYVIDIFGLWSIAFFVICCLTYFYTPDKTVTYARIKSVLQVLVFANLLMPYIKQSKKTYEFFLWALLLAAIFLLIRILISGPVTQVFKRRLGSTVGVNPNTVGYVFSIAAVVSLYLMIKKRFWLMSVVFIAFTILSFFSGSKKVVLFIWIGSLLLLLSMPNKTKKFWFLLFGLGLLFLALMVLALTWNPLYSVFSGRIITMFRVLEGVDKSDGSTNVRLQMIIEAWESFLQKPLLGWGLGAFTVLSHFEMYSHNSYTELLFSVGIIGTAIYYFIYIFMLVRAIPLKKNANTFPSYILSIALIGAMLVDGIARVPYNEEISNVLLALCYAGIWINFPNKGFDPVGLISKVVTNIRPKSSKKEV